MRSQHTSILLIIALYLGLASTYSVITPLGEGPDEPGHAKYVFFLAREGRLPVQCAPPCVGEVPGEGHQPPLAYALMLPALLWMPREERSFDLPGNRQFVWAGGQEVNAAGHGSRELWPWRGEVLAWHLARLINVLIGCVTVLFTYLTARSLTSTLGLGQDAALFAAILLAFNPQFLFTSSLINNDGLLTALCAMVLWSGVRGQGSGVRGQEVGDQETRRQETGDTRHETGGRRPGAWERHETGDRRQEIGDSRSGDQQIRRSADEQHDLQQSVLTDYKLTAALTQNSKLKTQNSSGLSSFILHPSSFGLGFTLGLALLTKQSAFLLVPIVLLSGVLMFDHGRWLPVKGLLRAVGALLIASLVAGWWYLRNWQLYGDPLGLSVFLAEFQTQAFNAGSLVAWRDALLLLHESFWARFGWMNIPAPAIVIWFYTAIELAGLIGLVLLIHRITMFIGNHNDLSPIAYRLSPIAYRLLLIAYRLSPIVILLAFPLLSFAWVISFALSAGLVAWQGRLLFPALPAIAVLLGLGLAGVRDQGSGIRDQGSGIRDQGSGIRDQGSGGHGRGTTSCVSPEPADQGSGIRDQGSGIRDHGSGGHGRDTTSCVSPEPAASSQQTRRPWIRAWGLGGIILGLTMFGLALWLPFGVIRPSYPPQTIAEDVALARIGQPFDIRFADRADERGAELRSVAINGIARPGQHLTVTLLWHALGRQNRDWWVFIHLVDAQDTILAEANGEPRQGAFSMSLWSAGDWIEDQHLVQLPADLPPGSYRLRMGLWDVDTQERSGVFNRKNRLIGDSVEIGIVEVGRP